MSYIDSAQVSDAKRAANRRNAQLSTGPRSAAGKERSSQNALKWGLFTDDHVVLPGESQEAHEALVKEFWDSLRPADPVEAAIVERMIASRWKLCRLRDFETTLFEKQARRVVEKRELDYRYEVLNDRKIKKPEKETFYAQSHQREADFLKLAPGKLLLVNDTEWDKLAKHEKRLEDAFFKAQRELRLWRKEKRANAACGFADQDASQNEATPPEQIENSNSQNEPTATATPASTEPCDAIATQPFLESTAKEQGTLPANPIQLVRLTIPEGG